MLLDSMITLRAPSSRLRSMGIASASLPCSVRTQNTRAAPATKKRDVSDSPVRSRSSVIAHEWSPVAQSQASPLAEQIPWPHHAAGKGAPRLEHRGIHNADLGLQSCKHGLGSPVEGDLVVHSLLVNLVQQLIARRHSFVSKSAQEKGSR